jgi:DNA-binding transcriptional regulator YiaG
METEIWKDIQGYEGNYKVSSLGRVKSIKKNKITLLKFRNNGKGYNVSALYLNGSRKDLKVHRLVALSFLDNPKNKSQVNHKNGIKSDNRLINLEWCNQSENTIHSYKNGLQKMKLSEKEVLEIRSNCVLTQKDLSKKYNISKSMVGFIKLGKRRVLY